MTTFQNDLFRGLGSALNILQSCADPAPFFDTILRGCLHNTTYDMQCEGDRGWYLHQAAKLSGNESAVEEAVRQKFFRIKDDAWLFNQMCSILYHFAVDGSETARNTLYQQYENMLLKLSRKRKYEQICHQRDMFEWLCVWLCSLDGWSTFKKIVDDISGLLLTKNKDFFFMEWFNSNSESKFGKKRVLQYLQKQSQKSTYIRTYYEKAIEWDTRFFGERPIPTLNEVLEAAKKPFSGRGISMRFARNASLEDLEELAQAAIGELDAGIQTELLWAFRRNNRYAFPEEFLLKLSQSADEKLRSLAYDMMGVNPSGKTRELARDLIQSGSEVKNGVYLLTRNLLPEDEELLYDMVKAIRPRKYESYWHHVYMCADEGIKIMRGKPKTDILEFIYRNTLCGYCRESLVRTMYKKGVLSDEVLRECRFDANSNVRKFAERIIRNQNRRRKD